jgi:hypothetical protein
MKFVVELDEAVKYSFLLAGLKESLSFFELGVPETVECTAWS